MLPISKPLSAGQTQTYHQKEFTAKVATGSSQGNGKGDWPGSSALPGPFLPRSSRNSARASLHGRARSLCGNERRTNIRMPSARQSGQCDILRTQICFARD
jgi:hypothetical protein